MVAVDPCVIPNKQALPPELHTPSTLQAGDGSSGDESEVSDIPHSESDLDGVKYRSRVVRTHFVIRVYLNEHCSMLFFFTLFIIYIIKILYNLQC